MTIPKIGRTKVLEMASQKIKTYYTSMFEYLHRIFICKLFSLIYMVYPKMNCDKSSFNVSYYDFFFTFYVLVYNLDEF